MPKTLYILIALDDYDFFENNNFKGEFRWHPTPGTWNDYTDDRRPQMLHLFPAYERYKFHWFFSFHWIIISGYLTAHTVLHIYFIRTKSHCICVASHRKWQKTMEYRALDDIDDIVSVLCLSSKQLAVNALLSLSFFF